MIDNWEKETWEKLNKKLSKVSVKSYDKIPYTTIDGVHDNKMESDPQWWTNGFWSALMVLMYAGTKNEQYLKTARHGMELLDDVLYTFDGLHHDVGFMWNISAGVDYRLTGDLTERNRMLIAANHLMSRYNPDGEYIVAWNGEEKEKIAIIDCMMNIPLLYRTTEKTGVRRYSAVANKHANKTMKYHIRPDGSCNHINEYDTETGEFIKACGGQGYKDDSSWSRGQAWGVYGFALAYRYTRNQDYLDTAKRIAHYFIANMEKNNWLPLCDFRQPADPVVYDSTAGACAACGLLEIADLVDDCEKDLYKEAAIKITKAIEKEFCDWSDNNDAILLMGTQAYGRGIHIPIIYGDYFFAEAIYRLMGFDASVLW